MQSPIRPWRELPLLFPVVFPLDAWQIQKNHLREREREKVSLGCFNMADGHRRLFTVCVAAGPGRGISKLDTVDVRTCLLQYKRGRNRVCSQPCFCLCFAWFVWFITPVFIS